MRSIVTSRRALAVVAAVALLALGACGDDDDTSDDTTTETTGTGEVPAFETIQAGVLTVCTDAPYPPFEFEEGGEWTGFDMELLKAIIEPLDLELAVTVQPFDGIWLAPAAGTCDLVASAMTITEERQAEALFSDPYFDADQSLMIRTEDEDRYASLDDLGGARIGVQTGTTGAAYAREHAPEGAEVVEFDEAAAMFLALQSGDVDALLQDFPVNLDRANQGDEFVVTEQFPTGEQYGFATAPENTALIDAINQRLAEMRDDGTYDAIFEEWFPGAQP
jgi:ABC-type amino acid transport substrate-binding protein